MESFTERREGPCVTSNVTLVSLYYVCRWFVLDADTHDLVSMHTDGDEIISNVKFSPGKISTVFKSIKTLEAVIQQLMKPGLSLVFLQNFNSGLFVHLDGNFLAVSSHDNFVYIYTVTENGRKYSRVGKCTVSAHP